MSGLAIVLVVLQMSQTQPVCVFLKGELWFKCIYIHTHKKKDKEEEKIFKNLQRFTVHGFIKPQVLNLLLEVQ